jgi:hypothetical protein
MIDGAEVTKEDADRIGALFGKTMEEAVVLTKSNEAKTKQDLMDFTN